MTYKSRAKYKNIKRFIYKIQETLKFKFGHISHGSKVVIFGGIITFMSLFFPWVTSLDGSISGGGFSKIAGKPGIMLLIILLIILFSIFSIEKKSKLQLVSNVYFKDYTSCILGGIFILVLCINTLSFIGGLQMFESNIVTGKGPILALCGGIMILIGGTFMKISSGKNTKGTFVNESKSDEATHTEHEKNNMKLPF